MRVLFAHQNFPGQYRHLAPALSRQGAEVRALTMNPPPDNAGFPVIRSVARHGTSATHPWARDLETKVIRAETTLRTALKLRDEGFRPDVIVGHPGWGDTLFLKEVWPEARLGIYCEYYYQVGAGDHDFDPEFPYLTDEVEARCSFGLKNLHQKLHFPLVNGAIAPTRFQAGTYPAGFRSRIDVVHDGIDTATIKPNPAASVRLSSGRTLSRADEVITFVSRNLEPARGFHIFMRALPAILKARPEAQVVIVGGDGVSYGAAAPEGKSWKDVLLAEVGDRIDASRVHFVGKLPYDVFLELLKVSRLHVYLTYPFVLSWSFMEAMAVGAPMLASATEPVEEVLRDRENGRLFPFFDAAALAEMACELLGDEAQRDRLSAAGRETIVRNYDLRTVCLPRQIAWVDRLNRAYPVPAGEV